MNMPASRSDNPEFAVIEPAQFATLTTQALYELLGTYGVVLMRDCIHEAETFSRFVKNNSSRLSLDPARTMVGGAAQLVDAGTQEIGLHCENGNSPFWPDITWFYCQEAPRQVRRPRSATVKPCCVPCRPNAGPFSRTTRFATAARSVQTNGVVWSATTRPTRMIRASSRRMT